MYIYVLIDPRTSKERYIGVAVDPVERLREHCRKLQGNTHKINWLKQLEAESMKPVLQILERCADLLWAERECYWIDQGIKRGWPLTNSTKGGEGSYGRILSDETKEKISIANRGNKKWQGRRHSEKTKQKQREIKLGNTYAARLSKEVVLDIVFLLSCGVSGVNISRLYHIDKHTVSRINTGKSWGHVTGIIRK